MLLTISSALHRFARGWIILVLFVLDASFMGLVLPMVQGLMKMDSGGPGPLDLMLFYTPAKAYEMISAYGEYGRSFYRNVELTVDILYPIVYTLFFALLVSWLFQRGFPPGSRMQRLNVWYLGGWLFDLLENLGIVGMLTLFPAAPAWLAWLTAGFTFLKWIFAGGGMLLLLIALLMALKNGFRRQPAALA
jgi:hypothetical protein